VGAVRAAPGAGVDAGRGGVALAPRVRPTDDVTRRHRGPGRTVLVDPIKPTLKPPGTELLKLSYDMPFSKFAFNFNLRRYSLDTDLRRRTLHWWGAIDLRKVGRCRLTVSKFVLKAPMVSALEATM
jgi:hypothetical protein